MNVDQIVWQVEVLQCPNRHLLQKGVVVGIGSLNSLTLSVAPLVRYHPTTVEALDFAHQPLHKWFGTRGEAIKAAKAICRTEALLKQTELDDNLTDKITRLTALQPETICND